MHILPYYDNEGKSLSEGDVYTLHTFCSKKFSDQCKNYYQGITEPGFYTCPFGYTTFASSYSLFNQIYYTSLLVQGKYDKKKLKIRNEQKNKFSIEELSRLMGLFEAQLRRTQIKEETAEDETNLIRGILHEVRRLSREISSQRTELKSKVGCGDEKISALVDNIYATSQLISIRIDSYELYKNPSTITSGKQPNIPVYKKFDKARFIINAQANNKKININFIGEAYFTIDGYEIFDLLPYILLDNAVKYTRNGMDIDVIFNENERTVAVKNIGPYIPKNQLKSIFDRGFRGQYTGDFAGSGLGLFMAKQIAELHKIRYYAESSESISYIINKVPYSEFIIMLNFNHKL